jgi:hypothetical protein
MVALLKMQQNLRQFLLLDSKRLKPMLLLLKRQTTLTLAVVLTLLRVLVTLPRLLLRLLLQLGQKKLAYRELHAAQQVQPLKVALLKKLCLAVLSVALLVTVARRLVKRLVLSRVLLVRD